MNIHKFWLYLLISFGFALLLITGCKKDKSFPNVTTTAVTQITTSTANSGGKVTSDGGANITERGICYSTAPNPTISNDKVITSGTTGTYISIMTGLIENTVYYVRAYATNSMGTAYGKEVNFTTIGTTIPTVSTTEASLITVSSATIGGNIVSNGGATIITSGVCWSTTANPVATGNHTTDGGTLGFYYSSITDLAANTLYYARAYATNSMGTAYGNKISFTTMPMVTPITRP